MRRLKIVGFFHVFFFAVGGLAQESSIERQSRILAKVALTGMVSSPVRLVKKISQKKVRYTDLLNEEGLQNALRTRNSYLELNLDNTLAFQNTDADYASVATRPYGYCGGLTDFTKKMAFLAIYDEPNEPAARLKKKEYIKRLKSIAKGNVERLPGFQNLREISEDLELQDEIKKITTKLWAKDALRPSGLGIFLKARKTMNYEKVREIVDGIEERVERSELPRILFSAVAPRPQGGKRIHSVMIWKVERLADETIRLYAWETNTGATREERENNVIEISPSGEIFYPLWLEDHKKYSLKFPKVPIHEKAGFVAQLREVKEDRKATAKMAKKLQEFYQNNSEIK